MARIRTLKPELLTDEKTSGLSDKAWRLFVSCILMADDYGNFRATDSFLHSQAFFNTDTAREEVANVRGELATLSLLEFYQVKGQTYGHVAGWSKHQRVDKPGKPVCPGKIDDSRMSREPSAKVPGTPVPDLEKEKEEEKEREWDPPVPACDPCTTEHGETSISVSTVQGLIHCMRVAIERAQPENGMWNPGGPFAPREAEGFLAGFGDTKPVSEIRKRVALFAADKTMAPWTVKRFVAAYNGIGQARASPPVGTVRGRPIIPENWQEDLEP